MLGSITIESPVQPAPTPRATIARLGGTARLYHFHTDDESIPRRPSFDTHPSGAPGDDRSGRVPLLVVPSLINRWYIVDLRRGRSLCGALVSGGIDTFCLDWGVAEDEDRYLSWDELIARIRRAVNAVRRATGAHKVGLLGYCMGATVASIYAALEPSKVAAFVNLAGPIDFDKAGVLRELVDPRWFDADAIADAGNVAPHQMQSGFSALRPTLDLAKWVRRVAQAVEPMSADARAEADLAFRSLEAWASDNVPFPGEAYRTYIRELYQQNRLIAGTHRVGGHRVDLSRIDCPVLSICASRDTICPADAATALGPATSASVVDTLTVPGGHVGAVVGSRAAVTMYPAAVDWLRQHLAAPLHH